MHFLPTTLKVVYVLSTPMPVLPEFVEDEPLEATRRRSKWETDDYICRGHILNGMYDSLFDIYQNFESAKELWDSLESKYMVEDASSKKFLVSNFMGYKMVDSRPVMEQLHEMLRILGQFVEHNLKMDEAIYVAMIIDKLPPSWKNFKHNLKHNKEELTLTQIGSHLRIEESIRTQELDNNPKGKNQDDKFSNKKAKLVCWNCNKPGHFKKDCRLRKVNKDGAGPSGSKDPEKQPDGSVVKMGNVAIEPIKGIGSVLLTFTSGKCLCLNNVLYVPVIRKNLVSEIVLNNCGYKQVLESDNDNSICMDSSSTSNNFHKSELWNARLGHIHYKRLKDMSKMSLIPAFDMQNNEKCKTCMLTKITRQPFKDAVRESKVLDLIHSDLCDFHAAPSLGNQKYVVTLINDASRYCYIYLLHSKDEALDKFKIYKQQVELHKNELIKVLGTDRGGIDCIFIAYAEHSKAYRFYVLESNDSVSVNIVIESRDVIFYEEIFTSIPRPRDMIHQSSSKSTTQDEDVSGGASSVPEPRKSTKARKAKYFGSDFQLYLVEGTRNETVSQHQYCFNIKEDPKTFSEAMASRDVHFWKEAIHDEIDSIMHNNTWVLVDLPPGCKAL
uniref:CCHC-type domain-containing protein n=1 Tax=Lactuca sativa TaxID=4236 RepID=A0A9R1W658_LACSA|nr:hypothetical protein LSAT_V11C300117180 [Lactuca sativa]